MDQQQPDMMQVPQDQLTEEQQQELYNQQMMQQ